MLFNSYIFIFIFLPIVLFGYFLLNSNNQFKLARLFLIATSLVFIAFGDITATLLLITSLIINLIFASIINKYKTKLYLYFAVLLNILLLVIYKYLPLVADTYNLITGSYFDINNYIFFTISFFTFHQIIYINTIFKEKTLQFKILDYLSYIMFFPKLISGPIIKYNSFTKNLKQENNIRVNYKNIIDGLLIFVKGLFYKVVFADTFAIWAKKGFSQEIFSLNFVQAWVVSLSNTFQIYFDVYGYITMATGVALMFNIKFPENFKSPYKSKNILEFWESWFISLTQFFKENIYDNISGKNSNNLKSLFALLLTFLIAGIWHKINLPIMLWAGLNSIGIAVYFIWKKIYPIKNTITKRRYKLKKYLGWFITLNFINICWISFRANDLETVKVIISGMLNYPNLFEYYNEFYILWPLEASFITFIYFIAAFIVIKNDNWLNLTSDSIIESKRKLLLFLIITSISIILLTDKSFIYYGV